METYRFENINYQYQGYEEKALSEVAFSVNEGEFIVVCGASGSGKSTLLRVLKEQNPEFAYVMQNPVTQIVTDNGYHELAFGMENQGISLEKMKQAIAETATYFGMEALLDRETYTLSGGEKQLLNLAAAIVMNPRVLLLDEPTSQLDPMAATEFLEVVKRINEQMGVTVILVEQRLDEVLAICDRMLVLHDGRIAAYDTVPRVYEQICQTELAREYLSYMPSYVRLYDKCCENSLFCPTNVKECRNWFYSQEISLNYQSPWKPREEKERITIHCDDIYFRYDRKERDILKGVGFQCATGYVYGIAGGNGSGKSTFLKVLSGREKAYHGTVHCEGTIAYLPQEPKYMFIKEWIRDIIKDKRTIERFGLAEILNRHPYDISGGQMQRLAMAVLYEKDADVYLFDEPTKGLDPHWKSQFRKWVQELAASGKTVVMVSHDVEFAANTCDYMTMCFRGELLNTVPTETFFSGNRFYTTTIYKIVRDRYPEIVSERFLYEEKE